MVDHEDKVESVTEKIKGDDSSSSLSDSGDRTASLKSKAYRIFGREKPVHKVLGGGKRM